MRVLLASALLMAACSEVGPACPLVEPGDLAPSAGCFAVSQGELLVVQGFNVKLSLPGGSSEPGESARCTAFRETWEETGLHLVPGELLRVFDTGFHLYRCERDSGSGGINPPLRFEVQDVFYLQPGRFGEFDWRYPDQRDLLRNLLLDEAENLGRN